MVNIKCTEKQAMLIEMALDAVGRCTSGQLREMVRVMECFRGNIFPLESIKYYEAKLSELKTILFPELEYGSSYGVGMKEIGDAQLAYEMVKKLQNFRTRNMPEGEGGVLRHEPLHYSKEPLIEITESE